MATQTRFAVSSRIHTLLLLLAFAWATSGCATTVPQAGFLNDYSGFEKVSEDAPIWQFFQPEGFDKDKLEIEFWRDTRDLAELGEYDRVMIEPVVVQLEAQAEGYINPQQLAELTQYMNDAIAAALQDAYPVVQQPATGVLHLRMALTELKPTYIFPQNQAVVSQVSNSFGGRAGFEAEAVDAVSGERVIALIGRARASRWGAITESDLWAQSRRAIDALAQFTRAVMDYAHGEELSPVGP